VEGAQAHAGLTAWARRTGTRLLVLDDGSSPDQAARAHEKLHARGCRFVLGPYGSDSARSVAAARAGEVVWNHGAAADDVQRMPGVVSVPSPASRYLVELARAVAALRMSPRLAVRTANGRFPAFAREGLERAAPALGVELVRDVDDADAVLFCGPLRWELERLRPLLGRNLLLGAVSAGLAAFPQLLGADPDGVLAPVQWHPGVESAPEVGPTLVEVEDYVAAQAYAACLIAEHCVELRPDRPLVAARALRTTTFFGAFELDPDGLQVGHRLAVVRWQSGGHELLSGAEAAPAARPERFDTTSRRLKNRTRWLLPLWTSCCRSLRKRPRRRSATGRA
jgi:ABC-type branched-subunit amino acid transport system substrate-binding protein